VGGHINCRLSVCSFRHPSAVHGNWQLARGIFPSNSKT